MPAWTPEKQRQQAIVRRLRLVGAGPAAYFTDACHLMDGGLEPVPRAIWSATCCARCRAPSWRC